MTELSRVPPDLDDRLAAATAAVRATGNDLTAGELQQLSELIGEADPDVQAAWWGALHPAATMPSTAILSDRVRAALCVAASLEEDHWSLGRRLAHRHRVIMTVLDMDQESDRG